MFVIGAQNVRRGPGRILLEPGRGAELGDVGIPYVRVYVEPPAAKAVDLDALVSRRPALGMFNALFAGRESVRGEIGVTDMAASQAEAEERAVIAFRAPVEDRAGVPVPIVHAPVEELPVLAFRAPAEERMPAWFSAPVEERSFLAMPLVPAAVGDRRVIVFNAPVEDRGIVFFPALLAPVEYRAVFAFNAPVEDRAVRMLEIPTAPVEDRQILALKEVPEAAAAARANTIETTGELVVLARPVLASQATNPEGRPGDAPIRVAIAPSVVLPLAMVSAGSGAPVVKLPAVQRRLPRIMVDHRGAVFHL